MYAQSPDDSIPHPGSGPPPFSVQLYPYHQQAFRQRYPGPQSPATHFQDHIEPKWPPPPPPPRMNNPQPRPRPPFPSVSTSLPPIHDDNRQSAMYASSPQSLHQGNHPAMPNPAGYNQGRPPFPSQKPLGAPVGAGHRLSTLPHAPTQIHPQASHPNNSGPVQHQSYTNHPVPGQYTGPSRYQSPQQHNLQNATMPFPQPSSVLPVDHAPSYSPPSESYVSSAASISLQPLPVTSSPSPPPMFQEDERMPVVDEKPRLPPPDDEHEFAIAMAMSQAEMIRRKTEEEKLSSQEEEDLARALAESLQMTSSTHLFGGDCSTTEFVSQPPSSYQNSEDLSPLQLPIGLPPEAPSYASASSSSRNTTPFVEDVGSNTQNWQMPIPAAHDPLQEGTSKITSSPSAMPSSSSYPTESFPQDPSDNLPVYSDRLSSSLAAMESLQRTDADESRLVFDDEAYARQLLQEEEDELRRRIEQKGRMEAERQQHPDPDKLPRYTSEGLLSPDVPAGESSGSSRRSSNANEVPQPMPAQPARIIPSGSTPSSSQVTSQERPPLPANEQRSPLQTVNSSTPASSSTQASQTGRPGINQHGNQPRPHTSPMSSAVAGPSNVAQLARHSSAGVVNPNHFLDRELLTGVSIGFKPPSPALKLTPMEDPMPNIITLPSKKCPPLHLMAPSWNHMLRLLFRLSNTRIEPTIEAMSDTKAALKLRTIIQFILPNLQAVDVWRTILWFTIDQAVPPNALGAARYTCGNPNVLPWSYTLSPLPVLLRGASDTAMSKTYTIPATDAIPFPSLPITFPNLALYLHAVMEESRKHSRSDALAGIGKLGKMVQMAYPRVKEEEDDDDGVGRSSVAGLFKRVIGRGGKDKKKGRSNNEVYQMVIPFVSDGWG